MKPVIVLTGITGITGMVAAWMSGSALHEYDNADSLLLALVSLLRWTPFYWEQNRFGMLIPLLAMPIRHPLGNLIFQGWFATMVALLAPYLVVRYLAGERADWIGAGSLANALLVVFAPLAVQFDWLVTQPYALSTTLAFGALVVLERSGLVRSAIAAALLGMAAGLIFSGLSSAPHTSSAMAPFSAWPHGWLQLLSNTASSAIDHPVWLGLLGVIAVIVTATLPGARRLHGPHRAAGSAVILAVEYWLAVGSSHWVELNVYLPRYLYPSLFLLAARDHRRVRIDVSICRNGSTLVSSRRSSHRRAVGRSGYRHLRRPHSPAAEISRAQDNGGSFCRRALPYLQLTRTLRSPTRTQTAVLETRITSR